MSESWESQAVGAMVGLHDAPGSPLAWTQTDTDALRRAVETIQRAAKQKVGTARASAKGGGVTEDEYRHARLMCMVCATVLVESGVLDGMEVDA